MVAFSRIMEHPKIFTSPTSVSLQQLMFKLLSLTQAGLTIPNHKQVETAFEMLILVFLVQFIAQ